MSRLYFIDDASGKRQLGEAEFPLRVGGKNQGGIVLPEVADDDLFALIAISNGHAYIQPATSSHDLFHNSERLKDSQWLKSGDRIQTGEILLTWQVQGDKVLIDAVRQLEVPVPQPPLHAPPEPPVANNVDMPVHVEKPASSRSGKTRRRIATAAIVLLGLSAIYLLMATPIEIKVEPRPSTLKMKGFPPPITLWGSQLVLPGTYQIEASLSGYQDLNERIEIVSDGPTEFAYALTELPGLVQITTSPAVPFKILIDGDEVSLDKEGRAMVSRGMRQLQLDADRYLVHNQEIEVQGLGKEQHLEVVLKPAWAHISISSDPSGVDVTIDGTTIGQTPVTSEILQGSRSITLTKPEFKPLTLVQSVTAGHDIELKSVKLEPVDGQLTVNSNPDGATVTVDGAFLGTAPLTVNLVAGTPHTIRVSKSGYSSTENAITLQPDQEQTVNLKLKAEYGTVFVNTDPSDATILVDGKLTDGNRRLRLSVRPHTLTVSKVGYVDQQVEVSPQRDVSQNLKIRLEKVSEQSKPSSTAQRQEAFAASIVTAGGQTLQLMQPDSILSMGASRREPGRRANESRRQVQLRRPFYFSQNEVTNREFRRYRPSHDSGQTDGARLNGESQPAVNLSWQDAARYCNWLSAQDGLPPAYTESKGKLVATRPLNTGYRLPTEAEWAWVARKQDQESEQRYPWKGSYPPKVASGNYADARIADTLADIVPGYDDGYRGTSPVASFSAWPEGIRDLGGNAAEWIHDYYAVYPGAAQSLVLDPAGPESGEHHVVRGASWRHGNITELRLSYRDYSSKPRYDLGFRIARYAE